MAFNTQSYLDAITPPTFTHNGKTWVGKYLSVPQYVTFLKMLDDIKGSQSLGDTLSVYRKVTDLVFPPPTRQVRRFWGLRTKRTDEPSVADILSTLPFAVQTEAIKDFTNSLAAALTPETSRAMLREMDTSAMMKTTSQSTSQATGDVSLSTSTSGT